MVVSLRSSISSKEVLLFQRIMPYPYSEMVKWEHGKKEEEMSEWLKIIWKWLIIFKFKYDKRMCKIHECWKKLKCLLYLKVQTFKGNRIFNFYYRKDAVGGWDKQIQAITYRLGNSKVLSRAQGTIFSVLW